MPSLIASSHAPEYQTQVTPFALGGAQSEPYQVYVMGDPNVTVTAYAVCVDQQFLGS